jgi:hypothetical protein
MRYMLYTTDILNLLFKVYQDFILVCFNAIVGFN